jgi:hypothetical protein
MIRSIKWGIWAYMILLIFEGALRKWVFPGFAEPLLIVRDPVAIGIYLLAAASGTFPRNGFLGLAAVLAIASIAFTFIGGHGEPRVTLYGFRTNYLHLPLIWIMAETLDLAIATSVLMIMQNRAGADAWVNRGVGGGEGGQIHGAMGRGRPPGFFSFTTGPMMFLPLAMSFCLAFIIEKKKILATWFVLIATLFVVLALPISISRGVMIITGCVVAVFLACIVIKGAFTAAFARALFATGMVVAALSFLPITQEAWTVFMSRWDTAAAEVQGDAWGSLTSRVAAGFTAPFQLLLDVPVMGFGIGLGSNFAAKYLSGKMGFLLSENEWERVIQELGPLVGIGFIALRVCLWLSLLIRSWRALRTYGDFLPMLVTAATFAPLVMLQWAPPTQLGFAILGAGLALALLNNPPLFDEDEEEIDDEDDADDSDGEEDDDETDTEKDPIAEYEKQRRRMRGLA